MNNTYAILSEVNSVEEQSLVKSMTNEEILKVAPRCFCKVPTNPNVSNKYVLASTEQVIEDMRNLSWVPVEASQPRQRRANSVNSYHSVTFRNNNIAIYKVDEDCQKQIEYIPQLVLTNSHDGFNRFHFYIGLHKVENGQQIIMQTDSMGSFSIRHIHYSFSELQSIVNDAVQSVPDQIEVMKKMQNRVLTQQEKRQLALAAIRYRKHNPDFEVSDALLDEMLEPAEQSIANQTNLWNIFSTIHEKIMTGNFFVENKKGKLRKCRKINSVANSIYLNRMMFNEAAKFIG